jgi:NarL family two-component system response regulator LiaR
MTESTIRVLVVDDQPIVREGLCAMLSTKPGIEVVGEADSGEEAVFQANALQPDVILMDLVMPGMGGVTAIRDITQENPEARILVLSGFSEDAQIVESIRAGAQGYILKSARPEELVQAIRLTHAGETPLNPAVARTLVRRLAAPPPARSPAEQLTEREIEILRYVAGGASNQDIADALGISVRTVGTHVSHMMSKLGLDNRTQLALFALREGLASLFSE